MSGWQKFAKEDLILLPHGKEMAYSRSLPNVLSEVAKWGQMKLWLTYVNLLNYYIPPPETTDRKIVMLVIGASPGFSIPLINKMYPGIEAWHIYDKQMPKFEALPGGETRKQHDKPQDAIDRKRWLEDMDRSLGKTYQYQASGPEFANIKWHDQFFEDPEIDLWQRYREAHTDTDIVFVSDIRRYGPGSGLSRDQIEMHALEDHWLQARAVKRIRPIVASLKFRPPWSDTRGSSDTIDLVSEDPEEIRNRLHDVGSGKETKQIDWLVYLDGAVMFQQYIGPTSSETRLIVTDPDSVVRWSILKYENQLSYHNRVTRTEVQFYNPFIPGTLGASQEPIDPPELLNNYDSVATVFSLGYYLNRTGIPKMYQPEMAIGLYRLAVLTFNNICGTITDTNTRRIALRKLREDTMNRARPAVLEGPKLPTNLGMVNQPADIPAIAVFPPDKLPSIRFPQFMKVFPDLAENKFIFPETEAGPVSVFGVNIPQGILEMVGAEQIPDLPGRPGAAIKVEVKETSILKTVDILSLRPPHYLTKFERAKVLGIRALQISKNSPPTIEVPAGVTKPLDVANLELKAKRLPLTIVRTYPDGVVEEWPVSQLALEPAEIAAVLAASIRS